jgi:hypothetical protein
MFGRRTVLLVVAKLRDPSARFPIPSLDMWKMTFCRIPRPMTAQLYFFLTQWQRLQLSLGLESCAQLGATRPEWGRRVPLLEQESSNEDGTTVAQ